MILKLHLRYFILASMVAGVFSVFFEIAAMAAEPVDQTRLTLSFHTLEGDSQQIRLDEIWRIRESYSYDEPARAAVIDYAFKRLFVDEPLKDVIEKVRRRRTVRQFTSPNGKPIYIVAEKIIGVVKSIPAQHHPKTKTVIVAREGQQQIQETRQSVQDLLVK